MSRKEAVAKKQDFLLNYQYVNATFMCTRDSLTCSRRHVRYMWIPFCDTVVVVVSNPWDWDADAPRYLLNQADSTEHARRLLSELSYVDPDPTLTFTQIRDKLLLLNPLDINHVK